MGRNDPWMKAAAIVMICVALLFIFVFATGSTFGQRCAHAFPGNGLAQERCINDLSEGKRP